MKSPGFRGFFFGYGNRGRYTSCDADSGFKERTGPRKHVSSGPARRFTRPRMFGMPVKEHGMKPFVAACEMNRAPILEVLRVIFAPGSAVLEIGSGTGQHAVYFGAHLPQLTWHTSDLPEHHDGIRQWLDEAALDNVRAPIALDVTEQPWTVPDVDAVYSANTAHIMSWPTVSLMINGVAHVLPAGGLFALYGPFNYAGAYTSAGNARFDQFLRAGDPACGIRDFAALDALASAAGLALVDDHDMPANNRLLVWRKTAA